MTRLIALALMASALAAVRVAIDSALEPAPAYAGTLWLKSCSGFGDTGSSNDVDGPVWQPEGPSQYSLANRCPLGGSFQINDVGPSMPAGTNAQWRTVTPPTIGITGAITPLNQVLILPAASFDGFAASYFWNGGTQTIADESNCCGGMYYGLGIDRNDLDGSRYFGFQVTCISRSGCALTGGGQVLDVKGIELTAEDNTPPAITASGQGNLWYQSSHWVRGTWPITFTASDDSGVCSMGASIDGQAIVGPTATPDQSSWTQCPTPQAMNQSVDTASYPDGTLSLQLSAADAASPANTSAPTQTLHVDNQPVSLALSGPTDVPSTAGVQYVSAVASAGPSGVADIQCSVDGAPFAAYSGAAGQVPVRGVGQHVITCYAQNNAIDATGQPASSSLQTWHLSIRQPTVAVTSFGSRLIAGLRCHSVTVRRRIPAHWVTVNRQGRKIRVHRNARTVRRRQVLCLRPAHAVPVTHKRVRFGQATTVRGWIGLAGGTALGGVPVEVIAADDNGLNRWHTVARVTTSADGVWRAKVRTGPSRLIASVYAGSSSTEPAISNRVHLTSGTKVLLNIRPRLAQWGQTIQISGRLLGGNIPVGKLLRLRIGTAGIYSTVGIPGISHNGRYHTTWTFAPGHGLVRYWFSVSTLPEADYPYAQTSSARVYVTVSS